MPRCGASEFFFFQISDVFVETIITSEHQISHFYKSRYHPACKRTKLGSEKPKKTNPAVTRHANEPNTAEYKEKPRLNEEE